MVTRLRKLLALLLTIAMIVTCAPALADEIISEAEPVEAIELLPEEEAFEAETVEETVETVVSDIDELPEEDDSEEDELLIEETLPVEDEPLTEEAIIVEDDPSEEISEEIPEIPEVFEEMDISEPIIQTGYPTSIKFRTVTIAKGETLTLDLVSPEYATTEPLDSIIMLAEDSRCEIKSNSTANKYLKFDPENSTTITGKAAGTATVDVTVYFGVSQSLTAKLKITVKAAATSMKVKASDSKLYVGDTVSVKPTFSPSGSGWNSFTYQSSNPEVLYVNEEDGSIEAVGPGTAFITATATNGKSFSAKTGDITVYPFPNDINFIPEEYTGEKYIKLSPKMTYTVKIDPEISDVDATVSPIDWKSEDEKIAKVDQNGKITAVACGTTLITASVRAGLDKVEDTFEVEVTEPVASVKLLPYFDPSSEPVPEAVTDKLLLCKDSVKLLVAAYNENGENIPASFSYSSSKTSVLKVSKEKLDSEMYGKLSTQYMQYCGVITLNAQKTAGSATVKATAQNKKAGSVKYSVKKAATSMTVKPSNKKVYVGGTVTLKPTFKPSGTAWKSFDYESSDTSVLTVDENGVVTGVAEGSAFITMTAKDGKTFSAKTANITVVPQPTELNFIPDEITGETYTSLSPGMTYTVKIDPNETDVDTSIAPIKWRYESNPKDAVTVDQKGKVTAVKPGQAYIYAEVVLGDTTIGNYFYVYVTPPVASVRLIPSFGYDVGYEPLYHNSSYTFKNTVMGYKEKAVLLVLAYDEEGDPVPANFSFSSSNKAIIKTAKVSKLNYKMLDFLRYYDLQHCASFVSLTALSKAGSATITAKAQNGKKGTIKLSVKNIAGTISMKNAEVGQYEPFAIPAKANKSGRPIEYYPGEEFVIDYTDDHSKIFSHNTSGVFSGAATFLEYDENNYPVYNSPLSAIDAAYNYKTEGGRITIVPAPEDGYLTLDKHEIWLTGGKQTAQLTATQAADHKFAVTWYVDGATPSALTYDQNGKITTAAEVNIAQNILINATLYNGVDDSCLVHVLPTPKSIYVESASLTMTKGDTVVLHPEALDAYGDPIDRVEFKKPSGSNSYATIAAVEGETNAFIITAKKTGTAKFTFKTGNGVTKAVTVTVKAKPTKVKLPEDFSVSEYQSKQMKPAFNKSAAGCMLEWSSSNESIAKVDNYGNVYGVEKGECDITVTSPSNPAVTDTKTITVLPGPADIEVNVPSTLLSVGMSEEICVMIYDSTDDLRDDLSYKVISSDPSVIAVSGDKITAKKEGFAYITVLTNNPDVWQSVNLEVQKVPDSVYINVSDAEHRSLIVDDGPVTLHVGSVLYFQPFGVDNDNYMRPASFTVTVSSETLVDMYEYDEPDYEGWYVVEGLKASSKPVTITVKSHNGKTASIKVLVSPEIVM